MAAILPLLQYSSALAEDIARLAAGGSTNESPLQASAALIQDAGSAYQTGAIIIIAVLGLFLMIKIGRSILS
jgi:hypothetical protein